MITRFLDNQTCYRQCKEQLNWKEKTILIVMNDPLAAYLITVYYCETNAKFIHTTYSEAVDVERNIDLIIIDISLRELRMGLNRRTKLKRSFLVYQLSPILQVYSSTKLWPVLKPGSMTLLQNHPY